MKKGDNKKKLIILIIILLLVIIVSVVAYFLIFKKGVTYFGFTIPDFSKGANLGDIVGNLVNSNPWKDTKLNPFENES